MPQMSFRRTTISFPSETCSNDEVEVTEFMPTIAWRHCRDPGRIVQGRLAMWEMVPEFSLCDNLASSFYLPMLELFSHNGEAFELAMNLEAGLEVHAQRTLVILLGPRNFPAPLRRVSCRIAFCNV